MNVHRWNLQMVNPDKNQRKFYRVYETDRGVTLHWGRIGTNGQSKFEELAPSEARILARKQVYAKLDKGYELVDEAEFQASEHAIVDDPRALDALYEDAKRNDRVTSKNDLLGRMEEFTAQVRELIGNIQHSEQPDEDLIEVLGGLRREFGEVKDAVDGAETALEIAQMAMMEKV